jgi:Glycosyltransferase family 87
LTLHGFRRAQATPPTGSQAQSHGRILPFAAGGAGIAILLFTYYKFTWGSLANFKTAISTCGEPFCDFASFYYPMGEVIFHTSLPIPGFVYSPFIAILFSVFSLLEFNTSLVAWGILQILCVILCLLLFRWLVPAGLPIQLLFVALVLSSFPLLHNFTWGQVGMITMVALLGLLVLYERDQRVGAAVLLALAVSFKFYPLIFLIPFVFRRDTRFLLIAVAACVLFLFGVPGVLLGGGGMLSFYAALLDSYREFGWVASNSGSQYFPHVMLRLAQAVGYDAHAHLPLLRWIAYGIAAANIGLIFLVQRARLPHADLWSLQLLFLTIPFVMPTSWPVDLVFLPFTQALLAWQLLEGDGATSGSAAGENLNRQFVRRLRAHPARSAVTISLLILSIILSNIIFFNLVGYRYRYDFSGCLFWANLLLLVASYIEILPPALRRIGAQPADESSGSQLVF